VTTALRAAPPVFAKVAITVCGGNAALTLGR
jgi:hypothetical protein